MTIGLKLSLEFAERGAQPVTFGDLQRFVKRAEAGGATDGDELHIDKDENDETTGFSLHLNPES
jgi:hypothetical protein